MRERKKKPVLLWKIWEQENEKWVAENSEKGNDLSYDNDMWGEIVEPPPDLIMPLLRHQKEWLAWSLNQEASAIRGGILADEMGMGKTVQAISLVLTKREMNRAIPGTEIPASSTTSSMELPAIKGTLVLCPLVAAKQWVSEIERCTSRGSTEVLLYHGGKREKNLHQFSEYDFVITTYSVIEADYRKYHMPKEKCHICGNSFYDNKLKTHVLNCKPNNTSDSAVKTKRRDPKKERKSGEKENSVPTGKSLLHSVKWDRIILDEAHYIKDRRSNTARAVFALQSSHKWALSGTPFQNHIGELYSLRAHVATPEVPVMGTFNFSDLETLNFFVFARGECPHCPHKPRHFCWWNKYISPPSKGYWIKRDHRFTMILLIHKILKSILLRRTKKGRAADLALPPKTVIVRRDTLDVEEEDYYTALYNNSRAQFNAYIEAGMLPNYAYLFAQLTSLRLAVNHPYLVEHSLTAMKTKGKAVGTSNGDQCSLCHDLVEDPVVTSCAHVFCNSCLTDLFASMGHVSCPSCSKPLTVDFTDNKDGREQKARTNVLGFKSSSILNRIPLKAFKTSTKIEALREEIRFMVERDGSAKGIVFSQFTSFLDLIHYSLEKSGVNCVQLDGSMPIEARDAVITRFKEDPDCRIFLMSLKAAGVALNLTVASNVFMMDPWWNPALERQAHDRIYRIGQYKPIRIVRFVIENTVEEEILKLKEEKELMFDGTVEDSSQTLPNLKHSDLMFLFGLA
ncbi:Helicase protein with RING/U-box domain [Forsythia ovata]|uniref:Helicase protein with RING/U-box domain n=1 Tax=Forsythia ovata TaxID=205694 RepID=A0ABD1R5F4_9LAMI